MGFSVLFFCGLFLSSLFYSYLISFYYPPPISFSFHFFLLLLLFTSPSITDPPLSSYFTTYGLALLPLFLFFSILSFFCNLELMLFYHFYSFFAQLFCSVSYSFNILFFHCLFPPLFLYFSDPYISSLTLSPSSALLSCLRSFLRLPSCPFFMI